MNINMHRSAQNEVCTQGVMTLPNNLNLQTLELPWVPDPNCPGGQPDVSCVPPGTYQLVLHDTVKHPKTFALVNPDLGVIHEPDPAHPNFRTACLIHVANFPRELEGCIGIGMSAGVCQISDSAIALNNLKNALPWIPGHTLTISGIVS